MAEYIEREAFRREIDEHRPGRSYEDAWALTILDSIPAADVRPVVRGRWIPVGLDDIDEGMFKCSECGSEHFFPEILIGIPADNYCTNCGADMREES